MKHGEGGNSSRGPDVTDVEIVPLHLPGCLRLPPNPFGIVVFAHGSGSSRLSPRNVYVAEALGRTGLGTLLFDLLSPDEELNRANVFNIPLLSRRLTAAVEWTGEAAQTMGLPMGLFGASTGAAAALVAAARLGDQVAAVVSRGGRPDLAGAALEEVRAPTLLIVGGNDTEVIRLNKAAFARLAGPSQLAIIPGATHLFSEPGALDAVVEAARDWFGRYMGREGASG
ncbi:putative phosphoribosyl transferase [Mesorhizobium soli]|uniref:dienelactone hydrolase family protein n=1 Tax=Pseudaminobacter soli (ex Li et al. 2025) TaxID=1295366 RepID=UPI002474A990|nr:dienelactone hydrolase family protein [Mesorhizobium soli]MDH6234859.1 putative phosphoribosyl transferase [Mesorhizobium soli]